jgi:AcrR family transcriptional regulator
MTVEDKSVRERILQVAIRLLYKNEPESITVRQIAEDAGVNLAAINYYFRSKENLFDEAVLAASSKAFELGMAVLRNPEIKPAERLRLFFEGYTKGLVEFQGITKTAFRSFLVQGHGSDRYAVFMKEMLDEIAKIFREMDESIELERSQRRALFLYSGIAFPFMVMGSLRGMAAFDYADKDARNRYIALMVETLSRGNE